MVRPYVAVGHSEPRIGQFVKIPGFHFWPVFSDHADAFALGGACGDFEK
jgi:hypothetical protein